MSRRWEEEKTKMKKTKRKSSKLIAYLTVKICKKFSKRKCTALSNGQIGVFKISIVFGLNIIQISAKFMCNKLIPY